MKEKDGIRLIWAHHVKGMDDAFASIPEQDRKEQWPRLARGLLNDLGSFELGVTIPVDVEVTNDPKDLSFDLDNDKLGVKVPKKFYNNGNFRVLTKKLHEQIGYTGVFVLADKPISPNVEWSAESGVFTVDSKRLEDDALCFTQASRNLNHMAFFENLLQFVKQKSIATASQSLCTSSK